MKESWKDIMDYVFELEEDVAVIRGWSDITDYESSPGESPKLFKDITKDSFWIVMGRGDNEPILECIREWDCDVDKEGEYEFKAILKYYKGDYSVGESGYWEIEHIEFNFIQTFLEREREWKLNKILNNDFEKLFF
jgi:hypothetical protein